MLTFTADFKVVERVKKMCLLAFMAEDLQKCFGKWHAVVVMATDTGQRQHCLEVFR